MPRILTPVAALLALALLALACDGNAGGASPTPTSPTTGETPTVAATPSAGETPTVQPGKTPFPEPSPSPSVQETPTAQATTPTPPPTPAAMGTPAVAPADLTQYQGQTIEEETCFFDPRTAVTDCPGRGTYAIDPPIIGEDISCSVLLVQGEPVAIGCTSQEPLQTIYYAIQ